VQSQAETKKRRDSTEQKNTTSGAAGQRALAPLITATNETGIATPGPSQSGSDAVVIDSRSCRSAPTCFARSNDGGKKIRGVKIRIAVEKYGMPLAIDVAPASQRDSKTIVPAPRKFADGGFQRPGFLIPDQSYPDHHPPDL
jgi:hypothetical protein